MTDLITLDDTLMSSIFKCSIRKRYIGDLS
jgi:hypothetical protein